ncbi:MAG: transcriptional repressor [Clostridia bacterium]|nr:transcriptional repressor [Clostridia bacterium]
MQSYSTKQRKLLLSYLAAHADEELAADVISRDLSHEGVSVSAVYRNLAALEADGKIQKVTKSGTRRAFYRFSDAAECRRHIHLYCTECGKTYHADVPTTDYVADRIESASGFEVDRSKTVIRGVCRECGKAADTTANAKKTVNNGSGT